MQANDVFFTPPRPRKNRITRRLLAALAALGPLGLTAQTTFSESFTGTTAAGWVFGGNYTPNLTANTIDTPGDGWLRLTDNANNRATYALLDTQIFSVNAKIQIELDYAFYDGSGADGITFFLIDGSVTAASFVPGSFGGSLGYAQRNNGDPGMAGGYLGFGFDNFGNYSNPTEGRVGGTGSVPNAIAVRGPESSNWAFIDGSGPLQNLTGGGQMDFPSATTRPDQNGADFRSFRLTLDANNLLTVEMKFGASADFITAFTSDLSAFDRPETFKIGFTGATGGSTEIHEVRNILVTTFAANNPGSSNYEWDNDGGADKLVATGNNWVGDNAPATHGDLLFRNASPATSQTVDFGAAYTARSLNFESTRNHSLGGSTITLGDGIVGNDAAINVAQSGSAIVHHRIASNLTLAETTRITNIGNAVLCLNGIYATGTHTTHLAGSGSINFNGTITGSGAMIKNGSGITTINGNNNAWSGPLTINDGVVAITHANALGTTGSGSATTINSGGALFLRGGTTAAPLSTAEPLRIAGTGVTLRGGTQSGALHADGGTGSSFTVTGPITLTGDAAIGGRAGSTLTLSGAIGQTNPPNTSRALTKVGEGLLIFAANNTYTGATTIAGGALRVSNTDQIDGSNLVLNGGVLELSTGFTSFTRALGAGTTQVQWTGSGGFSASGSDVTVNIGGGTDLTWGSGGFVGAGNALLLSSNYADRTLTFQNNIALAGDATTTREIRVANGSAVIDAALSGVLSGSAGINKTGDGTLEFTANNTYTGVTRISGGAIRYTNDNQINGSNLELNGGVLEIGNTNFSRSLGTGGNDVRWTGSGGFAAGSADRRIRLNNNSNAVTWGGTANFVADGQELVFGSTSAAGTVQFDNALSLGDGTRTIRVIDSQAVSTRAEARLTRALSNGNLVLAGNGRLDVQVANNSFAGTVDIRGAELRLNTSGTMTAVTGFTVRDGGTLTLDNAGTHSATTGGTNNTDRITGGLTLGGGTLNFLGAAANSSEDIGAVILSNGANSINVQRNGTNSAQLTSASLNRTAGSTVDFTNAAGGGTLGTSGSNPRVVFSSAPTQTNGILAYATVNGSSFATHGADGITAITPDFISAFTATLNAGQDTTTGLGGATDRQVNSITFTTGNLDLSSRNLDIVSGGLLATTSTSSTINGSGTLTSSSGELIVHTYGTGGFTIDSQITNSGVTSVGLTKSGDGTLTLSGTTANTYTGTTTVNDGILVLAKSANTTAVAGDLVVGDGRGTDTVRITANEQIADTATVTLRGGELGNSANIARLVFDDSAGSITESFANLAIEGNTILDFAGGNPCSPTFLYLDTLTTAANSLLTIINWIEFTDYLLVKKTFIDSAESNDTLPRIVFDGYPGTYRWQNFNSQYYQITPVPEPATYGILSLGGLIGLVATRRRRRQP